eukprot:TRINITY_DN5412_c0_g1_i1.p1 TRINITY_DN5412_c0_g1~~TRINITY_DN5412_c0_g1_i1.p1  ORF type:complete len:212 (-),score=31.80 TRINITY_DN5412_c0_g1_i1:240-824(-)
MKVTIVLFAVFCLTTCYSLPIPINNGKSSIGAPFISMNYTLFKQCNSTWGSHALGTSRTQTICAAGCAMTSLSMILNSYGMFINGSLVTPLSFNNWLVENNGFVDRDLLVWAASDNIFGMVKFNNYYRGAGSLPIDQLKGLVDKQYPVIVNVLDGEHWVLVIGYEGTNFYVNDPGFDTAYYAYSGMSNYVVYNV